MQSKAKLEAELNVIVEEIGKARADGNGDALIALREKRQTLETEIDELGAEAAYISRQDAEAKTKAHELAIEKTLSEYDESEAKYLDNIKKLNTSLERLKSLEDALHIQVKNLIDSENPLHLLQAIWAELSYDRQKELQKRFDDVYSGGFRVQSNIGKILDRLSSYKNRVSDQARWLTVTKLPGPRKVGGGVRSYRTPEHLIPSEPKRTPAQLEIPKINRNKLLIPESGRPKRRPTIGVI